MTISGCNSQYLFETRGYPSHHKKGFYCGLTSPLVSNLVSNNNIEELTCGSEQSSPMRLYNWDASFSLNEIELTIQSKDETSVSAMPSGNSGESSTVQETVQFLDETSGSSLTYNPILDSSVYEDIQPGIELQEFLSRPVLIQTLAWSQAMSPSMIGNFKPWYDYFNSVPIKKKLDNYAFVSCNLKLKFIINASPFYYGSSLVSYRPLSDYASDTIVTESGNAEHMLYSQRPHLWLFPQTNQGGEMTLPFFLHKNWLDVALATDFQAMGRIYVNIVDTLKSANGATGSQIDIQVFAWAEDVRLLGPTVTLALQAKDEYQSRTVSKMASAIATTMGMMSKIPIIGPYMTATGMAASAVGSIAHLFGYTNVPNISDVDAFKPSPFPQFASPEISTPVEKLTLDPKNELTIDPRTVGLSPVDELAITNIITRESYLLTIPLASTDAVDTLLFSALVNPVMFRLGAATPPDLPRVYESPLSYISRMFVHWRGDLIFRFRFICTQYHKGRIRITYDPVGPITTSSPAYSTAFNQVIDIGAENDIEITVPYMQGLPWLDCDATFSALKYNVGSSALARAATLDNGTITIRVVNPLTAPVATTDMGIQVFVRAADNFEFAYPRDIPRVQIFSLQSQDVYSGPLKILAGNAAGRLPDDRYLVNMGENCTSLRQLLRRTNYVNTSLLPVTTTPKLAIWVSQQNKYPPYHGYDPNGINTANGILTPAAVFPYNYTAMTPYNWIAPLFVAQRGSCMWHYNFDTVGSDSPLSSIRISKYHGTLTYPSYYSVFETSTASPSSSLLARFTNIVNPSGAMGLSLTNQVTQTGLSVSMPNYNKYRFHFCDPKSNMIGRSTDGSNRDNVVLHATLKPAGATKSINNISVDRYMSIGTDFTFFFMLNVPAYMPLPVLPPAV
jgi:hypothetical protein